MMGLPTGPEFGTSLLPPWMCSDCQLSQHHVARSWNAVHNPLTKDVAQKGKEAGAEVEDLV